MHTLENECLRVGIHTHGAELKSIYNKITGLEYMWSGDPAYWAKTSPVLFPIVGSLKDHTCFVNGKSYQMGRHGFAREMDFAVTAQEGNRITFTLVSNEETLRKFPFWFRFDVAYEVSGDSLQVMYRVRNAGVETMYFSVGGHPAFKVPLIPGSDYNDYYLEFDQTENAPRWPISADGLIETSPEPFFTATDQLPLSKELFYKDALVFKQLKSQAVKLLSKLSPHGLRFDFPGFPFLGIWAFKNADFVCIEPWCGIADSVNSNQQLPVKEGINALPPDAVFERSWSVKVF